MRVSHRRIFPWLGGGLLAALSLGCMASIDPAAKASVDRQVAALQAVDASYAPPDTDRAIPPEAGQWTRYEVTDSRGRPSFSTYRIVRKEGDRVWLEIDNESYYGRTVDQFVYDMPDPYDPTRTRVVGFASLRDGRVQRADDAQLAMVDKMYRTVLENMRVTWTGYPQADVSVLAGHFAQAFHGETEMHAALGISMRATSWWHPAVPIGGALITETRNGARSELVAFGLEGAEPAIEPLP